MTRTLQIVVLSVLALILGVILVVVATNRFTEYVMCHQLVEQQGFIPAYDPITGNCLARL